MNVPEIMAYCQSLLGVDCYFPFGDEPACYRVGGKIFAHAYPTGVAGALRILLEDDSIPRERIVPMVILRCEPFRGDFYRRMYPSVVLRPYHSPPAQQPYANTVLLEQPFPEDVMREMIDHAYETILSKLPKRVRRDLQPGRED